MYTHPMRLLHFSDIHFAAPSINPAQLFSKRIIGNANFWFNRRTRQSHTMLNELVDTLAAFKPDHLLISGDFTTTGAQSEYDLSLELLNRFPQKPFAIPGNHDAYTKSSINDNPFYRNFRNLLPMKGEFDMSLEDDRVAAHKLQESVWLVQIDCSMYSSLLYSNGHFTPEIEAKLKQLLSQIPEQDKILLMCHYPFFSHEPKHRQLIHAPRLYRIIEEQPNVALYIHGHTHRHAVADLRPNGLPLILDSGSIAEKKRSTFNLIDLDPDAIRVKVYHYQSGWNVESTHEFAPLV